MGVATDDFIRFSGNVLRKERGCFTTLSVPKLLNRLRFVLKSRLC